MAKKTKDSNLSIEERLEQALIPNWDEPYKLPENWCWTNLGILCKIINGFAFKSNKFSDTHGTPVIRITNIKDGYVDIENSVFTIEEDIDEKFIVFQGDLLVAMSGATTGKNGVYRENKRAFLNQRVGNIKIINTNVLTPEFRNYYIAYMQDEILKSAYGGAQPNISSEKICQFPFALPPLAEQKRISNLLEKFFVKLEEAKEKAQEVVDGFETRKAAILHKAFSGELTAKWRENNDIGIETWKEYDLQSVCSEKITDGTHKTPIYSDAINGIPFLSSKDVTSEKIDWENIKYIDAKLHEELYARLAPQTDDVLLAKNGTTGVAALVDVEKVFDLYVTLAVLRPNKAIITPKFLHKIVNSPICKSQFNNHLKGIGVPNLHLRDIKKVVINVPTLPEQEEIVSVLEHLIVNEQKTKETAEAVIKQIDTMKKAILARAFRGELGTNNPNEESAVELLKQVLGGDAAVQTPAKKPTKRISIPSSTRELLSNIREEEIIKLLLKSAPQTVSIQEIMSISSKKFELMDALRSLEKKQLITKNESGDYSLTR